MGDANLQQNILMHLIGERPARAPVPASTQTGLSLAGGPGMSTIKNISASLGGDKLLTYQRMTVEFTAERLRGLGLDVDPGRVSQLDATDQMANLQAIGQKIAREQVNMEAVKSFFLASRAGEPS